jgi:hypothetical protein
VVPPQRDWRVAADNLLEPMDDAPDIRNAHVWLRLIADDLRDYAAGERRPTEGALYRLAAILDDVNERSLILPRPSRR